MECSNELGEDCNELGRGMATSSVVPDRSCYHRSYTHHIDADDFVLVKGSVVPGAQRGDEKETAKKVDRLLPLERDSDEDDFAENRASAEDDTKDPVFEYMFPDMVSFVKFLHALKSLNTTSSLADDMLRSVVTLSHASSKENDGDDFHLGSAVSGEYAETTKDCTLPLPHIQNKCGKLADATMLGAQGCSENSSDPSAVRADARDLRNLRAYSCSLASARSVPSSSMRR